MQYVIKWRSKTTGLCGGGTLPMSAEQADANIERANREYPDLYHWKEPANEVTLGDSRSSGSHGQTDG